MSGRLEAIWIKRFKRGPMDSRATAIVRAGHGIEDNANQGGKRQVTIISKEAMEELSGKLGAEIDPSWRRANLLLSGIDLVGSRGRTLAIGPIRFLIHGETRPCEQMDEAHHGLKAAMADPWRGGAFGEVLDDGSISVGDAARWVEESR
jgi:MOSC domain-containing protein YiiM